MLQKIYLLTVQLSSLYPELLYQKGAWTMFLRPLCSLTSDIEKLVLWLSQGPRNLRNTFFMVVILLCKLLSAGLLLAVGSGG